MPGTVGNVRLFGVPIRLHFTFLLLLVFLIFIGIGGQQSGLTTAVYVLALFASVLLHEIGHAVVARAYGVRTLEIVGVAPGRPAEATAGAAHRVSGAGGEFDHRGSAAGNAT